MDLKTVTSIAEDVKITDKAKSRLRSEGGEEEEEEEEEEAHRSGCQRIEMRTVDVV